MKKLLFILIAVILASGLLISGCGKSAETTTPVATTPVATTPAGPTTPDAGAHYGGTMIIISTVMSGEVGYPPDFAGQEGETWPLYAESLGEATADPTKIDPLLATSWEEDIPNKTLTVHLRKGVKFQDDTDFNAEAVRWNYQLTVDTKKGNIWKILKSMDILDNYTIRFNFSDYPYDTKYTMLAGNIPIFSPTAIETNGKDWAYGHAVTTGPFMVTDFQQDISITMKKFDNYWNKSKGYPYLDGIVWKHITDPVACAAMMISGEADVWEVLASPTIMDDMLKNKIVYHHTGPVQLLYWYLYPDTKPDSIFNDIRVRQAVAAAIDNNALCQALGKNMFIPVNQLVAPGLYGYNPDYKGISYDPELAKKLLADAGYPEGIHTTLNFESSQPDIAAFIQAMLLESNITVDLASTTQGAWYGELFAMGWDGLNLGFGGTGNDMWCVSSFSNWMGPQRSLPFLLRNWSPIVIELLNKGMYTFDDEARKAIGRQLIAAASDEMNVIPLYGAPLTEYVQTWVHANQYAEGGNGVGRHVWRSWIDPH